MEVLVVPEEDEEGDVLWRASCESPLYRADSYSLQDLASLVVYEVEFFYPDTTLLTFRIVVPGGDDDGFV